MVLQTVACYFATAPTPYRIAALTKIRGACCNARMLTHSFGPCASGSSPGPNAARVGNAALALERPGVGRPGECRQWRRLTEHVRRGSLHRAYHRIVRQSLPSARSRPARARTPGHFGSRHQRPDPHQRGVDVFGQRLLSHPRRRADVAPELGVAGEHAVTDAADAFHAQVDRRPGWAERMLGIAAASSSRRRATSTFAIASTALTVGIWSEIEECVCVPLTITRKPLNPREMTRIASQSSCTPAGSPRTMASDLERPTAPVGRPEVAAVLLVSGEDQTERSRRLIRDSRERRPGQDHRRAGALHVGRAESEETVSLDGRREWIGSPLRRRVAHWLGVQVSAERQVRTRAGRHRCARLSSAGAALRPARAARATRSGRAPARSPPPPPSHPPADSGTAPRPAPMSAR